MSMLLRTEMERLIDQEQLPSTFYPLAARFYLPLADAIASAQRRAGHSWMVGINGAQGTGKSTLCQFLELALRHQHNLNCVSISIDDLYYTRGERELLARNTHPLLRTRGVPGTHDVSLGIAVCRQLLAADQHTQTLIPRFNKTIDDRLPPEQWSKFIGGIDVLLFEGWCVGNRPQLPDSLGIAANTLERDEDQNGSWRRYVNNSLQHYQPWFDMIDQLIMLKAPSIDAIFRWRNEQEQKLATRQRSQDPDASHQLMDENQINRFVQHYQRLTTFNLEDMPNRADCVFHLDENHEITSVSGPLVATMELGNEHQNHAG